MGARRILSRRRHASAIDAHGDMSGGRHHLKQARRVDTHSAPILYLKVKMGMTRRRVPACADAPERSSLKYIITATHKRSLPKVREMPPHALVIT